MTNIISYNMLECITQKFATIAEDLQNKYILNQLTLLNDLKHGGIRSAIET